MYRLESSAKKYLWLLAGMILLNAAMIIQTRFNIGIGQSFGEMRQGILGKVHIIFFSIILEALPFVIMGVIGSMLLEAFVSPDVIRRLLPRLWLPGILISGGLGFLFPFCECGLVPIVRRLMEKGVPAYLAAVFLLAAPVVNPVVGAATKFAFFAQPEMVYWRLGGAYLVAVLAGMALLPFWHRSVLLRQQSSGHGQCGCGCSHSHHHMTGKIAGVLLHGQEEFFSILRYLVIGACLAAFTQVFFPRDVLNMLGGHPEGSVALMMGFAFLLSLCSGADAFVASTFINTFSPGALLAFMVFGPMVDLKNVLMMRAAFKESFVIYLVALVTMLSFILGVLINWSGVMA